MLSMQTTGATVIFHPKPQLAAPCIGKANQSFDQFAIRIAIAIALKFNGETFCRRGNDVHGTNLMYYGLQREVLSDS